MVMKTSHRLAMAAIMALGPVAAHAGTITVAVNGAAAPGGGTFSINFGPPVISNSGQVAFENDITGVGNIVIRGDGSVPLVLIARNGGSAPGGGTYSFPHDPAIADNGQVLFVSNITATLDSGLFRSDGIAPAVVVERNGGAAPGGGTYGGTPGSYGMNPTGAGAFDIGTTT